MSSFEDYKLVMSIYEDCLKKVSSHYPSKDWNSLSDPEISFDIKGRTAGKCCHNNGNFKIKLNRYIFDTQREAFVARTIPHEFAHMFVRHAFPFATAHGREWKTMMRVLGCDGSRCHSYETVPARKIRRVTYECACNDHEITVNMANKIERGISYSCCICKTNLKKK